MKKVMIILGVVLFFLGTMTGCKKKSEEEKVGELLGKLSEAKSESEERRIEKQIERITKRQREGEKKRVKEIQVKLDKPFTVWIWNKNLRNMKYEKVTRFSIIFENASISSVRKIGAGTAFPITIKPSLGKEFLKVAFTAKNLGPRKGFFKIDCPEVKIDNGNIYKVSDITYRGGSGVLENRAEQGETIAGSIYFEIPKHRKPYEITGTIGERSYSVSSRFCLKLNVEPIRTYEEIGRSGISAEPIK